MKVDEKDFDKTTPWGIYTLVFELTGNEEEAQKQKADLVANTMIASITGK